MTDQEEIDLIRSMAQQGIVSRATMMNVKNMSPEAIAENERMWADELQAKIDDAEYRGAYHKERMEALKTLFPRGHTTIPNIDKMVDIARADQLNPLYEQVLKDFEEAKLAMSRAANKLAQAVKLVDSDKLAEQTQSEMVYTSSLGGIGAQLSQSAQGTISNGAIGSARIATVPGPMGPQGMQGPQGPQGPKGDPGKSILMEATKRLLGR